MTHRAGSLAPLEQPAHRVFLHTFARLCAAANGRHKPSQNT